MALALFQSTRPRGARLYTATLGATPTIGFNPRARVGRDLEISLRMSLLLTFQSTRPRGARQLSTNRRCNRLTCFNPRARVGRDSSSRLAFSTFARFNPRARVGRDFRFAGGLEGVGGVSIHAPAWGATYPPMDAATIMLFQSTRPRGARQRDSRCFRWTRCFNPRARVGRDLKRRDSDCPPLRFNPRARVGRDFEPLLESLNFEVSIHAPAWGATRRVRRQGSDTAGFNPRARVGRDILSLVTGEETKQVSIHAPAWGATLTEYAQQHDVEVSIHAPAWGATSLPIIGTTSGTGFNPRARVGRDPLSVMLIASCLSFQSTRPRGARLIHFHRLRVASKVSIHAPAWGATT